jgi:hypothetical protein
MAVTTANIRTGGAVVTVGGTVASVDSDGFYIGTTSGTDIGCTTGGVAVSYTFETSDIFCDQLLSPVDVAITGESATIEFEMLETDLDNLEMALSQVVTDTGKIGVGGIRTLAFTPVMLKVSDNKDETKETTWTFYRCKPGGFATTFSRENPTSVKVTFTAYADTTHASGHQLFSINYGNIA